MFNVGDRVSLIHDPEQRGVIRNLVQTGAEVICTLQLDSGVTRMYESAELISEVIERNPWENLINDSFQENQVFGVSNTIHKVANNLGNTISALKASKTIFMPYQYKPLLKFLQSDTKRILVADEVGLGKTIEAGHIILELLVRGSLRNALVLCKNSLKEKWRQELKNKFNLDFKIFSSGGQLRSEVELDAINGKRGVRAICNYEQIRSKKFLDLINEHGYGFDLVVMDEAQFIRNQSTQTFKAVDKVLAFSDNVVMLTATPIMTDIGNLHSLLKLLDPAFEDRADFDQAISQNRPFVRALNQINNKIDFETVKKELWSEEIFVGRTFGEEQVGNWETVEEQMLGDPLFEILNEKLRGSWTPEKASEIQRILQEFNRFHSIYTRTRKRDVQSGENRAIRTPHKVEVEFTSDELELYNSEIQRQVDKDANILSIISRKRMMTSCWPVYAEKYPVKIVPEKDSKLEALKSIVSAVVDKQNKKIIVFSFFTQTLEYLDRELRDVGYSTAVIHGQRPNRQEEIERFTNDPECKIFLSSEVGSEGLDLQFCDSLVNYNLPWNPMVVEQRIGRIDRVGQKSKRLHIYNLVIKDTIEDKIYTRLLDRIGIFKGTLGDLEAILDDDAVKTLNDLLNLESDIYSQNLTMKEADEIIDQAAVAFENESKNLKELENNLDESFANDNYMQQEIERINTNKQYITTDELVGLLKFLFSYRDGGLPQFTFVEQEDYCLLQWYPGDTSKLIDFMRSNLSPIEKHPDLHYMMGQFHSRIMDQTALKVTFDSDVAFANKSYEYLSTYHPLINAAMNFFIGKKLNRNLSFKYQVHGSDQDLVQGIYLLGVINNGISKIQASGKESNLVVQDFFSVMLEQECVVMTADQTDKLVVLSQSGSLNKFETDVSFKTVPDEFKAVLEQIITSEVYNKRRLLERQRKPVFQSNLERSMRSQKQLLKLKANRAQARIDSDPENKIVGILQKEVRTTQDKIAELDAIHARAVDSFRVDSDLVTLCLIEVI